METIELIKNGEIDIVYVAPETLLSYNYNLLFGKRRIGLLVVDEAHVATTWGKGFRPDYWYLDKWINWTRKEFGNFEIVTFTATSTYSPYLPSAMNQETKTNLKMQNVIEIISPAYREDITYEISNIEKQVTRDEYNDIKYKFLIKKIMEDKKSIIYFPYKSQIKDFGRFLSNKEIDYVEYHGSNDKYTKKESVSLFKNGEIKTMLASKAFGMGIDIDDIESVLHFAPTGSLNDYIQEVGRAARKPSLKGKGITKSIFPPEEKGWNDFTHINKLYGMSSIKNYEIQKMARTIKMAYDKIESKNSKRMFLIPIDNFSSEKFDENKVKTAFLMMQRDLERNFKYTGLVIRPSSILTDVIVEHLKLKINNKYNIASNIKNFFKKNIFDEYYILNMEKLWEKYFKEVSFPIFKFMFFSTEEIYSKLKLPNDTKDKVAELKLIVNPRQIIEFEDVDIKKSVMAAKDKAINIAEILFKEKNEISENHILKKAAQIGMKAGEIIDFLDELCLYHEFLNKKINGIGISNAIKKRNNNYILKNKNNLIKPAYFNLLHLIKNKQKGNKIITPLKSDKNSPYSRIIRELKMFEILKTFSMELKSGLNPKVFISVNSPSSIEYILRENYTNSYVIEANKKFKNEKKIMKIFLTKNMTNDERNNFIESVFLMKINQDFE